VHGHSILASRFTDVDTKVIGLWMCPIGTTLVQTLKSGAGFSCAISIQLNPLKGKSLTNAGIGASGFISTA
jgi:hypothetical protein